MNSLSQYVKEEVPLTKLCRPKQWKTIPRSKLKTEGYPVYGANGVIGYTDTFNHEERTVLIACRGTCGQINICSPNSYVTGNAICLDELDDSVSLDYLANYLKHYDFNGNGIIGGSTQPQITKKGLEKVLIPIVDQTIQQQIVSQLDAIQSQITSTKAQLEALDTLAKARFVEMFGDPVSNPKNWDSLPIEKVSPQKGLPVPKEGTVWQLNLDAVETNTGTILKKVIVNTDEVKSSNVGFSNSHVLYSKLRPYLNKVVIPDESGVCTTEMIPLLPNPNRLSRIYLCHFLRSASFVAFISEQTTGAKMPRVDIKQFKKFQVPLPPLPLQQQFADFAKKVEDLKQIASTKIDKLQMLYDSLAQDYFGG